MSLRQALSRLSFLNSILISPSRNVTPCLQRCLMTSSKLRCEEPQQKKYKKAMEGTKGHEVVPIDPINSMKYLETEAYREMYGNEAVWKNYRRNNPDHYAGHPRKTCVRGGRIATGSPCPICRDDYLVFDYQNIKLMKQFINELSGEPLDIRKTGLCQKQFKNLLFSLRKAQDYGYLIKYFPIRVYNEASLDDLFDSKLLEVTTDDGIKQEITRRRAERRNKHYKMFQK